MSEQTRIVSTGEWHHEAHRTLENMSGQLDPALADGRMDIICHAYEYLGYVLYQMGVFQEFEEMSRGVFPDGPLPNIIQDIRDAVEEGEWPDGENHDGGA